MVTLVELIADSVVKLGHWDDSLVARLADDLAHMMVDDWVVLMVGNWVGRSGEKEVLMTAASLAHDLVAW